MAPPKFNHQSHEIGQLGTGLHVFAETRDLDLSSCGAMLDRFNNDIDSDDPCTAKPLGMVLNPTGRNDQRFWQYNDVWVLVYRNNFFVVIEKHNRYVSGPHRAMLKYKSEQTGKVFWIATLQITECMFYSQEKVSALILDAVVNKLWYLSDRSKKDLVVI